MPLGPRYDERQEMLPNALESGSMQHEHKALSNSNLQVICMVKLSGEPFARWAAGARTTSPETLHISELRTIYTHRGPAGITGVAM